MPSPLNIRDIGVTRKRALEREAKERGASIADVVRDWIDDGIPQFAGRARPCRLDRRRPDGSGRRSRPSRAGRAEPRPIPAGRPGVKQGSILRLRGGNELVCRVQSDLGIETPYTLCAPVVPGAEWGAVVPRLHVPIQLDGVPMLIVMSQMVAVPVGFLGAVVGDASAWRDEIVAAVDLLVVEFEATSSALRESSAKRRHLAPLAGKALLRQGSEAGPKPPRRSAP